MRLYPDIPRRRAHIVSRDLLVVALLALFALVGLAVHGAVDRLAVLGAGVRETGTSVQGGFDSVASAVEPTPLVGGPLARALRGAGADTGGEMVELGTSGEEAVHRLARTLGLVTFGLPAIVLLGMYLPGRVALARQLAAADRVLRGPDSPERRRAIAMRAAFTLPYGDLLAYTDDPLGDLAAERYDALVEAAYADAGLRPSA